MNNNPSQRLGEEEEDEEEEEERELVKEMVSWRGKLGFTGEFAVWISLRHYILYSFY